MPLVWRLVRPQYANDLEGSGNAVTGARWNSPGRGVTYASFNLSLCVLESYVHLIPELRIDLPEVRAVRIAIPDSASRLDITLADLPSNLDGTETALHCRRLGDAWLEAQEHLVCTMPSMIVPQERNVMINPAHALMNLVKIESVERFRFDPRLAAPRN